jgi:tetratricopeptide (TPR) repeat protein
VAQDAIVGEFLGGDVKKLELAAEGLPLIGRFWATGVGRGAFWVGFPLVSELAAKTTFSHAENIVIQLLADYGVLIGSFAIGGMGLVIGEFLKKPPRRVTQAAVLTALVAFGLHNLVDFNTEIPGVAVIAVALLAVLVCSRRSRITRLVNRPLSRPVLGALAIAALVMSLFVGLFAVKYNVDKEERDYLKALARDDEEPFSRERLAPVLERHPADWYIPFLVGVRTFHQGSENPLPWLTRALEINAYSASTHLYIGRVLLRADELEQAMREFRLAVRYHSGFAGAVAKYLVAKAPHFEQLSQIAVTREDKLVLWGALAHAFLVSGHGLESEAADQEIFNVNSSEPRSLARQVHRLIDRKQFDEALELAEKLTTIPKYGPLGARLEASVHENTGVREKALSVLERELKRSPQHPALLIQLAWTRQRAGDYQGALETTLVLRTLAQDVKDQARVAVLEGDISVAEGRIQMALARYGEANMVDPSDIGVLIKIANVAQKNGDIPRALIALKKIIVLDSNNKFAKERIEKIEKKEKLNQLFGQ